MSTTNPPAPAQPAASRVVPTREAFRILKEWADAHPQDLNRNRIVDELDELADPTVWDDSSRTVEVAGRLNALLASINAGVWTPPAAQTPSPPTTPAAPATTPVPAQPAPTPAPRPLPKGAQNAPSLWRRLIVAGAIVAGATGVGLAGSVVGAISVGLAAVGGLGGLGVASAVVAIRRGGLAGIAAAVGLVVATGVGVAVVVGGHVHATGGGVAALLAGAGIAALLAGGDELVAAMRMAADKSGTQRPQR